MFGCTYYILNDREHLGKFQAKNDKGIFLGYSLNSRAYRIFNLRTKTIMESINVVVDDLTDVAGPPSEGNAIDFTDELEKQFQNFAITPSVATKTESESETESSIEATSVTEPVDITNQTTRDPPTRIQKNHPTKNIIGGLNEGMRIRDKPKRNYHDMVRFVCYTSSIEPKNVKETLLDEYWVKAM